MSAFPARPFARRPHSGTKEPDLFRIASLPSIPTMSSSNPPSTDDPVRAAFEGLSLESRTATSTPSSRHKHNESNPKSGLPTPNYMYSRDKFINRSPFGIQTPQIFVESKLDDDVFSRDTRTELESAQDEPIGRAKERESDDPNPTPRGDRLRGPITVLNAQGLFPPKNTVFVANLSASRTDDQLESAVSATFSQHGRCYVKIRHDRNRHPFAVVTYEDEEDAAQALIQRNHSTINGREIRVEPSRARRTLIITQTGGGSIATDHAKALLEGFGSIKSVHPTTHQDKNLHGLPVGMRVEFAYYEDCQDALKYFNQDQQLFQVMEDPAGEVKSQHTTYQSPNHYATRTPRSTTDQKSIFVGNLPPDCTEEELHDLFKEFGEIKGCNVIHKPIQGGAGFNIFGFVEYATPQMAECAADAEVDVRGKRIRVEPKEYSARRGTRLAAYGATPGSEPPRRPIAWRPSTHSYQPAMSMPYGFAPYGPPSAYHSNLMGYISPPQSAHRARRHSRIDYASYTGAVPTWMGWGVPPGYSVLPLARGDNEEETQYRR